MRDNAIQFAVVREDPELELEVLRRHACRRALLIASGGCTALTLSSVNPELEIELVDPNPAQLALVRAKIDALSSSSRAEYMQRFNVENDDPRGLSECGNFESLFRGLRTFLHDLVLPRDEMRELFEAPQALTDVRERLFGARHWSVAFELFFADRLLEAMFGPEATQHAEPGSYPDYFRRVIEDGLTRADAADNPFLHHILLGHYIDRDGCLPRFLSAPARQHRFSFVNGAIDAGLQLSRYDLIDLSNIFDWMGSEELGALMEKLRAETRPGSVVMWRQLNNARDLEARLSGEFEFDAGWQESLRDRDRSLFYSSIHVGVRGRGEGGE